MTTKAECLNEAELCLALAVRTELIAARSKSIHTQRDAEADFEMALWWEQHANDGRK
jgi:hypothetical protein